MAQDETWGKGTVGSGRVGRAFAAPEMDAGLETGRATDRAASPGDGMDEEVGFAGLPEDVAFTRATGPAEVQQEEMQVDNRSTGFRRKLLMSITVLDGGLLMVVTRGTS